MFGFLRKPGARSPSAAIRRAIEADGLPLGVDRPSALAIVEQRGQYEGRPVRFIRIFEPAWAQALGVEVRGFNDLDGHQALVLKSGHVETDGEVVITARAPDSEIGAPMPATDEGANRRDAAHVEPPPDGR